jgi:lipopolysaccharide transport system ATP-binding protein
MSQITVSNLSKAFKLYPSKWGRLNEWINPFSKTNHELKWVLKNISFSVSPGEALGIIGVNGSGKSTLLKIISKTTQPTKGNIALHGKVAALLELGIGFHPDFTGRENVFMAGQLLGLNKALIEQLLPEIIEFAELEEYINHPVRFYSSGMQVRLAFSVATALRPDVLIVDEALSVGDAHFQHKCFARIREFKNQGTTLLIVSHDKLAIQSICDRAILLSNGQIAKEGKPEEVMDYYNALLSDLSATNVKQEIIAGTNKVRTISGSGKVKILDLEILDNEHNKIEVIKTNQEIHLNIKLVTEDRIPELVFGYSIKDRFGMPIFGTNTFHLNQILFDVKVGQVIEFNFKFNANLGQGTYSVSITAHSSDNHISNNYLWQDNAATLTIVNYSNYFEGVAWLPPEASVNLIDR